MRGSGLDPTTPIAGAAGGETLGDFWAWGYSNILTNNLRGVVAEFLVATALGETGGTRTEWDAFDVLYRGSRYRCGRFLRRCATTGTSRSVCWTGWRGSRGGDA